MACNDAVFRPRSADWLVLSRVADRRERRPEQRRLRGSTSASPQAREGSQWYEYRIRPTASGWASKTRIWSPSRRAGPGGRP